MFFSALLAKIITINHPVRRSAMKRNVYIDNMPLEQALNNFLLVLEKKGYFKTESETINTLEAQGRITAAPVIAKRSCPHYIASAMDGVAVKASTTYGASETNPVTLKKDQFLEVDTGDYVPAEYDAVIMIEDVNFCLDGIQIIKAAVPWQHIRSIGEDLVVGDIIVPTGTLIGPYEIASFITAAVNEVAVVRKPVVSIIPTGTELVATGSEEMPPGAIVDSNSRMLAALCCEWGAIPRRHDIVVDDKQKIRQAIIDVKDHSDMIIVCSGSSAGREDYSAELIDELGELLVHGIATRPGKPAMLGIIDNKPVIGVPGYPVSAQLVFSLFAQPVIYRKMGLPVPEPSALACTISKKLASHMGVDEYVHVNIGKIKDRYIAYPLNRGAGITTSLVNSDGLIHIERGQEGLEAGDTCTVWLKHSRDVIDNTLITIGSHDMAIDILGDILKKNHGVRLVSTNAGSMGGIMALRRKETHFSGIHLLDYDTGEYNITYLEKYLPNEKWLLINLVKRQQGLIVKKGNPLGIVGLHDLVGDKVRFINRQRGAGTRILLDYLLQREGIPAAAINGYNREEYTHLAVAASVKNDACDVGMGIYASALAMDLDFIPITEEQYDICILVDYISPQQIDFLKKVIAGDEFKQKVCRAGGYNLDLSGRVVGKSL